MLSDYGFKKAFGSKTNTLFLRTALKALLDLQEDIIEVEFMLQEHQSKTVKGRTGIVDIICKDNKGTTFIIEMQRVEVGYFIHRLKFYSFQEYDTLIKKGQYLFKKIEQTKIYAIAFLEKRAYPKEGIRQFVNLRNELGTLIDDQITYVIIQLSEFKKKFEELKTDLDKLLYIMKYTETATKEEVKKNKKIPIEKWVEQMLHELELSNMTQRERINAERAIANEAERLYYELEQEKREKKLKRQEKMLKQRDEMLEQKDEMLEQKEKMLEEKNGILEENRKVIAEMMLLTKQFSDEEILKKAKIDQVTLDKIRKKIKLFSRSDSSHTT